MILIIIPNKFNLFSYDFFRTSLNIGANINDVIDVAFNSVYTIPDCTLVQRSATDVYCWNNSVVLEDMRL